jgi:hypothetical protein
MVLKAINRNSFNSLSAYSGNGRQKLSLFTKVSEAGMPRPSVQGSIHSAFCKQ